MSNAADDSRLIARANTIWLRADRLAAAATHPFTKDQLALVALAARDARAWLAEPGVVVCPDRARSVEASLEAQGKRLDELEELLRVHGHRANPGARALNHSRQDG
jgi:hypothetical protein